MTDNELLAILSRAFLRVFRSFANYLRENAWPNWDFGEEEMRRIAERQGADAQRLGRYIADRQGSVYTGNYPAEYGELHFLNASWILTDWIKAQKGLVAELESDVSLLVGSADPGADMLRETLQHAREDLATLRDLARKAPTQVE